MKISKIHLLDYFVSAETISAEADITLLASDTYRGMFTIGTDGVLYNYSEKQGEKTQFGRRVICEKCKEFVGKRIPNTSTFVLAYIKENRVYAKITENPGEVVESEFLEVNYKKAYSEYEYVPEDLFVYASKDGVSLSIIVKTDKGLLKQFVANFNADSLRDITYAELNANYSEIQNNVLGRAVSQYVNGVYTLGIYGSTNQLMYTPTENVFSDLPPNPIRLSLPKDNIDRIATCINVDENGTHLFAMGSGHLYVYPFEKQYDCEQMGETNCFCIFDSPYMSNVIKMSSYIDVNSGKIYVWWLNRSGELLYTFAPLVKNAEALEFVPPILFRREVLFFEHTSQVLAYCTKDRIYMGSKVEDVTYNFSEVHISTVSDKTIHFKGFGTKVITDKPFQKVRFTAEVPAEVYLNDTFYRFTDITVASGIDCIVDIVQQANSLNPPIFNIYQVEEDGSETFISEFYAAKEVYERLLSLNTAEKIKNASYIDNERRHKLLAEGITDEQAELAANAISDLLLCNDELLRRNGYSCTYRKLPLRKGVVKDIVYGIGEAWDYACSIAKTVWDATIGKLVTFIIDIVGEVIKFTIKIADEILSFVLNTVSDILHCVVKLLEFIGIPVDCILDWLTTFIGIDEAMELKDVLKEYFNDSMKKCIELSEQMKDTVIEEIQEFVNKVREWGDPEAVVEESLPKSNTSFYEADAANMYFIDLVYKRTKIMNDMLLYPDLPKNFEGRLNEINSIISENQATFIKLGYKIEPYNFTTKDFSVGGFLTWVKKMFSNIVCDVLDILLLIIKKLFALVEDMMNWFVEFVNKPITVPIISTILNFFGLEGFSLMDIVVFPIAILINFVYPDWIYIKKSASVQTMKNGYLKTAELNANSEEQKKLDDELIKKGYNPDGISDEVLYLDNSAANKQFALEIVMGIFVQIYILPYFMTKTLEWGELCGSVFGTVACMSCNGISFALSYHYGSDHCPMPYNGSFRNKGVTQLWIINFITGNVLDVLSIAGSCVTKNFDDLTSKKKKVAKSLYDFALVAVSFCLSVCGMSFEAATIEDAKDLNFDRIAEVYSDRVSETVLEIDRDIFVYDNAGYICDDIAGIFASIFSFAELGLSLSKEKHIELAVIAADSIAIAIMLTCAASLRYIAAGEYKKYISSEKSS